MSAMRTSRWAVSALFSFALLALFADGVSAAAKDKPGIADADRNPVFVRAGKYTVTAEDFQHELDLFRRLAGTEPDDEIRKNLFQNLIDRAVLLSEVYKQGIDREPDVQTKLRTATEFSLVQELLKRRFGGSLAPTDSEIREFYTANRANFTAPERRDILYLTVPTKEAAEKIRAEAVRSKDFRKTVVKYVPPKTREREYFMQAMARNRLVADFGDKVFALKPGEISAAFRTSAGWHVALVTKTYPPAELFLDDVQDDIRQYLYTSKRDALAQEWLKELRLKNDVTVNGDRFQKWLEEIRPTSAPR